MTDAERIRAKVNQVRTRLFLVLLANFMAVAACGVVLVAVLAGFRNEPAGRPIVLAAVAFALTAGLLAFLRTPSGPATAERVDRRLGLQQRLETAWECLPSRDELDLLLLRDAAQRLHYVQTSVVAPLRLSRTTKIWLLTGVFLVLSVSIFGVLDRSNRWGVFPSEDSARAGQGSSPAGEAAKTTARATESARLGRAESRQAGPLDGPPQLAGRSNQRRGTAQDVALLFPGQEPPSSAAADKWRIRRPSRRRLPAGQRTERGRESPIRRRRAGQAHGTGRRTLGHAAWPNSCRFPLRGPHLPGQRRALPASGSRSSRPSLRRPASHPAGAAGAALEAPARRLDGRKAGIRGAWRTPMRRSPEGMRVSTRRWARCLRRFWPARASPSG